MWVIPILDSGGRYEQTIKYQNGKVDNCKGIHSPPEKMFNFYINDYLFKFVNIKT